MLLHNFFSSSYRHIIPQDRKGDRPPAAVGERECSESTMPPTEQVFWEAKASRASAVSERRRSLTPSTTVDDNGCIITRGFVIPSRTSSQSSLATTPSTTSSREDTSSPSSFLEDATPGFLRPTGSLYYAPELALLRTKSATSLHRPTASADNLQLLRPGVGRREAWQSTSRLSHSSGRFDDEELAETTCVSESGTKNMYERVAAPVTVAPPRRSTAVQLRPNTRRTKSDQVHVQHEKALKPHGEARAPSETVIKKRGTDEVVVNVNVDAATTKDNLATAITQGDSDSAITSESDAEYEDGMDRLVSIGISAQRNRPSYAVRRARNDERAAEEMVQIDHTPITRPLRPVVQLKIEQRLTVRFNQRAELVFSSQAEDVIASDSEDNDDDESSMEDCKMGIALSLAAAHRACNSITTKVDPVPNDAPVHTTSDNSLSAVIGGVNYPTKKSAFVSALGVKITPSRTFRDPDMQTPIEVKSFEEGSTLAPRSLRPSRSIPKPAKGVLKKSGSVSSGPDSPRKQVRTNIRRGSGEVVNGKVEPSTPIKWGCPIHPEALKAANLGRTSRTGPPNPH